MRIYVYVVTAVVVEVKWSLHTSSFGADDSLYDAYNDNVLATIILYTTCKHFMYK